MHMILSFNYHIFDKYLMGIFFSEFLGKFSPVSNRFIYMVLLKFEKNLALNFL